MPSDDNGPGGSMVARALEALAAPREAFDSALALTAEEIRGFLDSHVDPEDDGPDRTAAELGHFASGLIDADRFASLVGRRQAVDVEALHDAELGWTGLLALRARGEDLHVVSVSTGGDLVGAAADSLAEAGRAFRLARSVRFVRNGKAANDTPSTDPFPSRLWSGPERALAPPLVIHVDGADLRVSGLGDLLEGAQKLVLVVSDAAPPAPLARLIRPGLLVVQTTDADGLHGFADFEGPAIAALVPQGAAVFSHDPRRGDSYASRLVVESMPEAEAAGPLGSDDLEHLRELAGLSALATSGGAEGTTAAPQNAKVSGVDAVPGADAVPEAEAVQLAAPGAPTASAEQPTGEPADRLAAWLLEQAGL